MGVGAASSVSGLPNHEMVCSRLPQGFELMCELCDFLRIVLLVKRVGKPIRFVGVESHYCSNDGAVRHRKSCLNKLLVRFEVEARRFHHQRLAGDWRKRALTSSMKYLSGKRLEDCCGLLVWRERVYCTL